MAALTNRRCAFSGWEGAASDAGWRARCERNANKILRAISRRMEAVGAGGVIVNHKATRHAADIDRESVIQLLQAGRMPKIEILRWEAYDPSWKGWPDPERPLHLAPSCPMCGGQNCEGGAFCQWHPGARVSTWNYAHTSTVNAKEADACDDAQRTDTCGDCKGSGWYHGLEAREPCLACEGTGRV